MIGFLIVPGKYLLELSRYEKIIIMSSEVEETLKKLVAHKGVIGTIVVNNDGIPIKSTLDNHTTTQYAGLINQLVDQVLLFFGRKTII